MVPLPLEVERIIGIIEDAGYEAYVVGGSIRDALLCRQPSDWDIASSASVETILELFPHAVTVGVKYGIVKITEGTVTADAATFRIDGAYTDFRRPDEVIYTKSIEEDLKRRDFTINAMAYNKKRGIVDPFGGKADLESELIKTVGDPLERFEEDPLRILRGIRFAIQLNYSLHPDTFKAMKARVSLLEKISIERIREEFIKIIVSNNCRKGLELCERIDSYPYLFGNISTASKKALSEHTKQIDKARSDLEFRLALIYLCLKKEEAVTTIYRMKYSNELTKLLMSALFHMEELASIKESAPLKQFIRLHGRETFEFLESLLAMYQLAPSDRMKMYDEIISRKEPIFIEELAINGNDLIQSGIKEGREIGEILNLLLEKTYIEPKSNNKESLINFIKTNR